MKKIITMMTVTTVLVSVSCNDLGEQLKNEPVASITAQKNNDFTLPSYYGAVIHTVHFEELASASEAKLIAQDSSLNFIYHPTKGCQATCLS